MVDPRGHVCKRLVLDGTGKARELAGMAGSCPYPSSAPVCGCREAPPAPPPGGGKVFSDQLAHPGPGRGPDKGADPRG